MIFNTIIGAGNPLNFSVAVSDTEPAQPGENMIWVHTAAFSQWVLSPDAPAAPTEGMLWIALKDSGAVSLNILKANAINLYPGQCRKYGSGSWTAVTAQIRQNGSWISLTD